VKYRETIAACAIDAKKLTSEVEERKKSTPGRLNQTLPWLKRKRMTEWKVMGEKKHCHDPSWTVLYKQVDLSEPPPKARGAWPSPKRMTPDVKH
jgi:hypothetical protein